MPLPSSCSVCTMFQQPGNLCRRHSPGQTTARLEVAHWPAREPTSRCRQGETDKLPVQCGDCLSWWQPDGRPLTASVLAREELDVFWSTTNRPEREAKWWKKSGLCVRSTAVPGFETQTFHPRVTHATDCCGDGEAIPDDSGG
jgi:hypothetical protein